jgi:G3E family GTPase
VNKIETVDTATKKRILAVCKQLNPTAKVLEASYSKINVKEIVNTNLFTFEKAATGAGWLRSLHELSESMGSQTSSTQPEDLSTPKSYLTSFMTSLSFFKM